jgi:hypothetical protein
MGFSSGISFGEKDPCICDKRYRDLFWGLFIQFEFYIALLTHRILHFKEKIHDNKTLSPSH